MTGNLQAVTDRRDSQRFGINAPLTVKVGSREVSAYTRDLSNRGVYFYMSYADSILVGQDIEFVVELPPEITLSTCCRIRCQGRVLRIEDSSWNDTGLAVEITRYSILREAMANG